MTWHGRDVGCPSALLAALFGALSAEGCVHQRCYDDRDRPASQICNTTVGECMLECDEDHPCGVGFECVASRCTPQRSQPIACPIDMVDVADAFCAD